MRWTKVLTVGAVASLGLVAACGAPSTTTAPARATQAVTTARSRALRRPSTRRQGPRPGDPRCEEGRHPHGVLLLDPGQHGPERPVLPGHAPSSSRSTHRALTTFVSRDGKQVLVPDLATDLGKASEDGLTWTFTLKDGVKFEDGTPVKAEDIVFAAKRSFDPDLAANGPTYQREFFKGGADYQGPYKGDKNWKGVEATDDKTVVFHLEKRFETLPYFVSFNQFTPIPEAKDTKADYQLHPLATGPYMFDKYTPGTELTLKRNPNWDPATDPARNNYPDGFHFKWGEDIVKTQTADPRLQRRRRHDAQLGLDRLLAHLADRGREEGPVRGGPVLLRDHGQHGRPQDPAAGPQGDRRGVPVRLDPQGRWRDHALVHRPPARSSRRRSRVTSTTRPRPPPASR